MRTWQWTWCMVVLGAMGCTRDNATTPVDIPTAINASVACLNMTANPVVESHHSYRLIHPLLTDDQCVSRLEHPRVERLPAAALKECSTAVITTKNAGDPLQDVHSALSELNDTYIELHGMTEEAHVYFREENYKDDGCKKGQELDRLLIQAFDAYFKVETRLRTAITNARPDRDDAFLETVRQRSNDGLEWHVRRLLITAETLADAAASEDAALSPEARLAAFGKFEKSYLTLQTYATEHPKEFAASEALPWWENVRTFYAEGKIWIRTRKAGQKHDASSITRAYNLVLSDTQMLRL